MFCGGGLTQLVLYGMSEQIEIHEKSMCFYDEKAAVNLNEKCKVCKKRLVHSLVVCLWCNKAIHEECIKKRRCPYCASNCYEQLRKLARGEFKEEPQ
jgi:hypothetical protein